MGLLSRRQEIFSEQHKCYLFQGASLGISRRSQKPHICVLCLNDFTINRCVALIGNKDSLNTVVTKPLTYLDMMIDQDHYGLTRIQPMRLDTKGFFD